MNTAIRQSYWDKITILSVEYTDKAPMQPTDADFGLTIDFQHGKSDPVKVFEAMAMMLGAFKDIDRVLIGAVDPDAKPIMVLEDVEAASITSWVKTKIKAIDDNALKEFDVKQQIGKYAVKAKYRVLRFLDEQETLQKKQELQNLIENLNHLGIDMPNRGQLFHKHIDAEDLLPAMDQIQDAKKLLGAKDKVYLKSDGETHQLNTSSTDRPSEVIARELSSKIQKGQMQMVLLVKKPDYLGNSLWEFRHGPNIVHAHVLDTHWLDGFRSGRIILQPGSALSCVVEYEYNYSEHGELLTARHNIVQVQDTMAPPANQNFQFDG